jgi:hypothetical protein
MGSAAHPGLPASRARLGGGRGPLRRPGRRADRRAWDVRDRARRRRGGRSHAQSTHDEIFAPLGMTRTACPVSEDVFAGGDWARGYLEGYEGEASSHAVSACSAPALAAEAPHETPAARRARAADLRVNGACGPQRDGRP